MFTVVFNQLKNAALLILFLVFIPFLLFSLAAVFFE
jgi:hypothetical protein